MRRREADRSAGLQKGALQPVRLRRKDKGLCARDRVLDSMLCSMNKKAM